MPRTAIWRKETRRENRSDRRKGAKSTSVSQRMTTQQKVSRQMNGVKRWGEEDVERYLVEVAAEGEGDQRHREGVGERTSHVEHQVELCAADENERVASGRAELLYEHLAQVADREAVEESKCRSHN